MGKQITYRVLIFDDQEAIRSLLWVLFDNRGYEVFTFPHPGLCPLYKKPECPCPIKEACADIILSDLQMPIKTGIDFLEEQLRKGCKCKNMALMSASFTNEAISKANSLGIKLFRKPFGIEEVVEWLEKVEKNIDVDRRLSNFFLQSERRV